MKRTPLIVMVIVALALVAGVSWWLTHQHKAPTEIVLYGNVDLRQVELAFNGSERVDAVLVSEGVVLVALSAASLASCTVGPNFTPPSPDVPTAWNSSASPATTGQPSQVTTAPSDDAATWWTRFNDPELTSLISRVTAANLDAKEAVLRIAEARAQRDIPGLRFVQSDGRQERINTSAFRLLAELIENTAAEVVYLDPWSVIAGGGLNDNTLMYAAVQGLKQIAANLGCAIVIIAHTRKGGRLVVVCHNGPTSAVRTERG